MSYTALYRKLRPTTFKDVVGQSHIVKTLSNQIQSGRISHAYLFCGTRGTGKTSTAKIFAKTINCLSPVDNAPCGVCEMCVAISANISSNVTEIDAASNNSVEDIRDLRETVKYPPTQGLYKVYIIDEIHMLSNSAFNALLKTLEEPPAHVVFILATTDPQKIPMTIHSRCQRFDFKRIGQADMTQALQKYMQDEAIPVTDEALHYVARISDGAMRDALSILDQCTSYYFNEEITLPRVLEIVGSVDDTIFYTLADALHQKDSVACMNIIDELVTNGRDIGQFVSEFIQHLRNLLVATTIQTTSNALNYSLENIERLTAQASVLRAGFLIGGIESFSELLASLKYCVNERVAFEIGCIKICNPVLSDSYDALLNRLETLEKNVQSGVVMMPPVHPEALSAQEKKPVVNTPKRIKAVPDDIKKVIQQYQRIISEFDILLKSNLQNCFPGFLNDQFLYIVCRKPIYMDFIKPKKQEIESKINEIMERTFEVAFLLQDDYNEKHNELFGVKDENASMVNIEKKLEDLNFPVTIE